MVGSRLPRALPHPVLDVVVDDEIELLVREAEEHRQARINPIQQRFGPANVELVILDQMTLARRGSDHDTPEVAGPQASMRSFGMLLESEGSHLLNRLPKE